jgi:UDP-N-acetylglucosamine 2-epimerase
MVGRALRSHGHDDVLIHTGQHYDDLMSDVFFQELSGLGLKPPAFNLGAGSGRHGAQTARMLAGLESLFSELQPDLAIVFGDTNSTLAGALAAAKLNLPVAHVEAGFRSYNRAMPEEVNRVLTDHASTYLFCATEHAVACLRREGIADGVYFTGDVMYDSLLAVLPRAQKVAAAALGDRCLQPGAYYLATVHRPANTDDPAVLAQLIEAFAALDAPVVLPLHPRTRAALETAGITLPEAVQAEEPAGYTEMVALEANARAVLTDSGGVQREAYFLAVPCVTLREDSEWPELVATGWNVLAGSITQLIVEAAQRPRPETAPPALFGDGHAAEKIVEILERDPPHR